MTRDWYGKWIGSGVEDHFHPLLHKTFQLKEQVKTAKLYICGVGLYEAYLNGKKIGNEFLAPYLNDYETSLQYQTYDVSAMLKSGKNKLEIFLGNGWYKGRFGMEGRDGIFGDRFAAIADLVMKTTSGKPFIVATDETWSYRASDILESGIYDGEIFDRNFWNGKENPDRPVEYVPIQTPLTESYSVPVIVKEKLAVKEILHTPAGETVLDFGQNFAGFVTFRSKLPVGCRVHLTFGEVLQNGNFYNENYGSAVGGFTYVSDGRKELVRPHFTYFGFRYVKIEGFPEEVKASDFSGCVLYSDLKQSGFLKTSDKKINQLISNVLWSQKSNFLDVPTDCPQRAERLGWTGDAAVFTRTACYNMKADAFYQKYLKDLRSEQVRLSGGVPTYFPSMNSHMISGVWGDAATMIPMALYEFYGDVHALKENYPLMKDWVNYIDRTDASRPGGRRYIYDFGFHFGDWLALDGLSEHSFKGATEDAFVATAYYYHSAELTAKAAGVLAEAAKKQPGKGAEKEAKSYCREEQKYLLLAKRIRKAFLDEYITPSGRLAMDTQAAYVTCLKFGLYREKEVIKRQFRERIRKDCGKIKCGFVGAPNLCSVLAEAGMTDLAYHFLLNEDFPGWLYEVNMGATTIWERWNSVLPDGTMNSSGMNSLNHYAYGAVAEFLYAYAAGIRPTAPGFRKICIAPLPHARLRKMQCTYDSVSGKIVSNWNITAQGMLEFHFEIPAGVKAEVMLPDISEKDFACTGMKKADEQRLRKGGSVTLLSGTYEVCYRPSGDYLHRFQRGAHLYEYASNEKAMKILQQNVPPVWGMVMSKDPEILSMTLEEMAYNPFMPLSIEELQKVSAKMEKIKA